MSLFEFSDSNEIMFIADRMKTQLYIVDENVIQQGDEASSMFVIFRG